MEGVTIGLRSNPVLLGNQVSPHKVGSGRRGGQGYIIAFDLDGTLVDSAPDIIGALNKVLHEQGVQPYHLDDARPLIGRGAMELLRRAFALAGAPLAPEQEKPLLVASIE